MLRVVGRSTDFLSSVTRTDPESAQIIWVFVLENFGVALTDIFECAQPFKGNRGIAKIPVNLHFCTSDLHSAHILTRKR